MFSVYAYEAQSILCWMKEVGLQEKLTLRGLTTDTLWSLGSCRNMCGRDLADQIKQSDLPTVKLRKYFPLVVYTISIFLVHLTGPPPMCHVHYLVRLKLKWTDIDWIIGIPTWAMPSWAKPRLLGCYKTNQEWNVSSVYTYKTNMHLYTDIIINA